MLKLPTPLYTKKGGLFFFFFCNLCLVHLADPLCNVRRGLLHGVQPLILGHGQGIVPMLLNQRLQPDRLAIALMSGLSDDGLPTLRQQRLDHVGRIAVVNAPPLLRLVLLLLVLVLVAVEVVERVVERVVPPVADDAGDVAVGVALDARLGDDGVFNRGDGEGVLGGGAGGRGAETFLGAAGGGF